MQNRSPQHTGKKVIPANLSALENQLQLAEFLVLRVGVAQRCAWGKRCVERQSVETKLAHGMTRSIASGDHDPPDAGAKQ